MKSLGQLLFICVILLSCQPDKAPTEVEAFKEISEEEFDTEIEQQAVQVVDKQLAAYNARDIEAFVSTYADSVSIYRPSGQLIMKGQTQLRNGYSGFFENTPALNCKILNRITINNKVIDKEEVFLNDSSTIYGVAVYTVEEGKIAAVHFIE